jgi:hypothetical protein
MRSEARIAISYILYEESKTDFFKACNHWHNAGVDFIFTRVMDYGRNDDSVLQDTFGHGIVPGQYLSQPVCEVFSKLMAITVDGDVHFCCDINEATFLGNVFETELAELLCADKFRYTMAAFCGDFQAIPHYCKKCTMLGQHLRNIMY